MGAGVFANGREVSARKSDNQSIAAMPDVCLSPPSPPAGPLPIPYPNFSNASDTSDGTKTVKIADDEVGMKDQSNYKTSKGDEAATRSFGMGVVSHSIQGKTYFAAWSSDVMFEGANAVRFMDMTTHNHGSPSNPPSGTASAAGADVDVSKINCDELDNRNKADERRLPPDYAGKGNTNSNYAFDSRSNKVASQAKKAHSKVAVQQMFPDEYVLGRPAPTRRKKASVKRGRRSNVNCKGTTFKYSGEFFKGGHSEPRIVETLFANSAGGKISGTLKLKINWKSKKPQISTAAPCEYCHALLCAAAHCGLKIVFCTEDNREEPLKKGDCPDDVDMTKPEVQQDMKAKNELLAARLKPAPAI